MRIHISFYNLVIPILFSVLTVMYAVEPTEPCPHELGHIVANMCTNESTVEEITDGYKAVDSILLRITKKYNNCICHISLQNTLTNYTIYMSKYRGEQSMAPTQENCGLAVDVEYVDTSNSTPSLKPIKCTSGTGIRSFALDGNKLKFTSRIIDGDFTQGYCMQIYRNQPIVSCTMNDTHNSAGRDADWIHTNGTQNDSIENCKTYCIETEACKAVQYDSGYCFVYNKGTIVSWKDNTVYSYKQCEDTQKLKIKCDLPQPTTQSSKGTTSDVTISTKTDTVITPISDSTMTSFTTQSSITAQDDTTKDKNSDLYVYIGAGAGGLLMILLIICIIICIRKNSNQTTEKESKNYTTKQFCKEDRDSDNDYGGLKDNVLYVSSEPEPNEILEDGNYNTVDLERTRKVNQDINLDGNYSTVDGICSNSSLSKSKPVIKPKPNSSLKRGSDEETIHLSTIDNSNNEYAVVDKGRNSDAVKHINPEHENDTEYAVVNKVKR